MKTSVVSLLATLRAVADELEKEVTDTEPAPVSVVLVRDESNGRIHRRARIHGLPGLMSYESDNADRAGSFTIIPDLSQVSDDLDLCGRCFGEIDGQLETT